MEKETKNYMSLYLEIRISVPISSAVFKASSRRLLTMVQRLMIVSTNTAIEDFVLVLSKTMSYVMPFPSSDIA